MLFSRVRTVPRLRIAPRSSRRQSPPPKLAATFSTTASFRYAAHREPNYYDILGVPVTASGAEIKKQFYSLSLRHHPDRNRDDPTASERFARISSAYNVLGNHTKRATYDRDHGILAHHMSTHSTAAPGQHPMGSYSSHSANLHNTGASYAGSRPASGLSKRRGPFRGPPPSFYAHGGYGNRKPPPGAGFGAAGAGGAGAGAGASGRVHEDDPTSFIDRNPVYHFNARGHHRTQTAEDVRRQQRRSREMGSATTDQYIGTSGDFAMRFIVVCGMLVVTAGLAGITRSSAEKGSRVGKPIARRKEE
ncbi:DnaJ domain protein [Aspergillus steynii IBT 23096]|uniref:DnaJ domain protein n=1 Tax=Aspergillus steynii IBT 23096 TaxID=1392250 RepID=A0A2I2GNH1_9EURO|nr:DnaJ domain protein [Aspergillus steynii IBT 23096]PLB54410.1 DnaJ domain protein [Aspergillus steynii IBT 23096]